jgi:transcription initiation factor TFIIB
MPIRDVYENGFDEECGKTIHEDTCPECAGNLVTDGGEISCTDCGLIIEDQRLDHGPEWRSFEGDESNSRRTGAALTPARHDRGLSSEIGYGGDANGNTLSAKKRRQISRLRRQHTRARWRSKAENNLAHACGEIARMTSALELPQSITEEASTIYRAAHREGLVPGRSIETMTAGSVYAACRCRGLPRTTAEITEVARCDQEKIQLGYRVLNVELGLETKVPGVTDRIPRFASACNVSDRVHHRAVELARLAEDSGIANGRNPSGVAAACIYLAGRELGVNYTQAELAEIAEVSIQTLRSRYYELEEARAADQFR